MTHYFLNSLSFNNFRVHVFKGNLNDDSAIRNAKRLASTLKVSQNHQLNLSIEIKRTAGGDEPYFKALEAGFRDWHNIVQPQFQKNDGSDDECFVVIYTDEPDEGSLFEIQIITSSYF